MANTPAAPPPAGLQRIAELDVLRGAAILAVVGLHTTWPYLLEAAPHSTIGTIAAAAHLACGLGVPLFLTLSAVGLALRHQAGFGRPRVYGGFLAQRARILLPAYALWSLVTLALIAPHRLWPPVRPLGVLLNGSADAQFYFIPLIFSLYAAWPLLRPLVGIAAGGVAGSFLIVTGGALASVVWWKLHATARVPHGTWAMLPLWLVYVTLGIAVAPGIARWRGLATKLSAIGGAAVLTLATFAVMLTSFRQHVGPQPVPFTISATATIFQVRPMLYIMAASMLLLLLAYRYTDTALADGLGRIGRCSYGIFLVHMLVLRALLWPWSPAPELLARTVPWLVIAIMAGQWATCVAASYAAVAAVMRVPALRPLVSNR